MSDKSTGHLAVGAACDAYAESKFIKKERHQVAMGEAIKAYLAALPGWRLVPDEATEEMVEAGQRLDMGTIAMPGGEHLPHRLSDVDAWEAWLTMTKAAPPPPGLETDHE